jgi:hypothetical protein
LYAANPHNLETYTAKLSTQCANAGAFQELWRGDGAALMEMVKGQGLPGGSNNSHRLIRRGMPYGPKYVPGSPEDGIERELLGYIINASIENQFHEISLL